MSGSPWLPRSSHYLWQEWTPGLGPVASAQSQNEQGDAIHSPTECAQICTRGDFCTRLLLFLPVTKIDEALEAIGEISHAENMEYSSDAQSSRPATATQALLTNLGVPRYESPGPHDRHTVSNTDASVWLRSMDTKEGHQWSEPSIHQPPEACAANHSNTNRTLDNFSSHATL
ncbi:hypothetical protein F7725_011661 [Dissostichus mawsoni]|uniref:Uncharacterized protein n=1 Tax=Dissostichus mawsoni TaxID=36200 RepID=A0A7J5ZA35_DISMA|nr:hypothetical protein F7725_011661 [Dissostichus mawsoni]